MRFFGIIAVGQGILWASFFSENQIIFTFSLLAIVYGFMVFVEDVIENPRKR